MQETQGNARSVSGQAKAGVYANDLNDGPKSSCMGEGMQDGVQMFRSLSSAIECDGPG